MATKEDLLNSFSLHNIRFYHHCYTQSSNPFFVWIARNICRKNSLSTPEWVEAYLDSASEQLLNMNPSPEDAQVAISKAFGFSGKGGPGAFRYREKQKRITAVQSIRIAKEFDPTQSIKSICKNLAGHFDCPHTTLESWYQRDK